MIVGVRKSGWILGAAAVLLKEPYPVCGITLTRCRLGPMAVDDFEALVKENFEFSLFVHQIASREISDQITRIIDLESHCAKARLLKFLSELVGDQKLPKLNKEVEVSLPWKNYDLACYLAVSPIHLSRLMTELAREGFIRERRGRVRVMDVKKFVESS